MKLEIECSWDNKQQRAKMTIAFGYAPYSLFAMPYHLNRKRSVIKGIPPPLVFLKRIAL